MKIALFQHPLSGRLCLCGFGALDENQLFVQVQVHLHVLDSVLHPFASIDAGSTESWPQCPTVSRDARQHKYPKFAVIFHDRFK